MSIIVSNTPFTTHTSTIKSPPWTYLHLSLLPSNLVSISTVEPIDAITAKQKLSSCLITYLGLSGAAIADGIDILKIEGREVWVRVAREDGAAVMAAVGEVWRVKGRANWLGDLVMEERGREVWRN